MTKTLVIYDSAYGNTEKIAQAIAGAIGGEGKAALRRAGDVTPDNLAGVSLLVVGSPTQGFRPLKPVADLLKMMRAKGLRGVKAAAFDTRLEVARLDSAPLRLLVKTGGYAAPRIGSGLAKAGAMLVLPPEGFLVEDTEGPLKAGELERAAAWAKSVLEAARLAA